MADNGFICGAFTPVRWPADAATRHDHVADPSGRTFLFSLVNAHGRAVKLRLQDDALDKALNFEKAGSGPCFGFADLDLMRHGTALGHGCLAYPKSFELDHKAEAQAGLSPIPFQYDASLLSGNRIRAVISRMHMRSRAYRSLDDRCFAAAEIEVYQLKK